MPAETLEPMQSHFAWIKRRFPAATIEAQPDGSHAVVVPDVPVEGYDKPSLTVSFTAPVGFPLARPQDFSTEMVCLASGSIPAYTKFTADNRLLWVHVLSAWDPQRDSLINYMGSILRRLRNPMPVNRNV